MTMKGFHSESPAQHPAQSSSGESCDGAAVFW